MIKRLKQKFIILSMSALLLLLALTVMGMNIVSYRSVVDEADTILSVISFNKGAFPESNPEPSLVPNHDPNRDPTKKPTSKDPHELSPETPYESRFFSVVLDEAGKIVSADLSRITSVGDAEAKAFAVNAYNGRSDNGFEKHYRYTKTTEGSNTRITFLDCKRSLDNYHSFLLASVTISLVGYVITFVAVYFLAGRIIRPISESYEKQKRFITDASHEIKTPLTIINANVDILEMELGNNECLSDIHHQIGRLRGFTDDLVMLTRMEEARDSLSMIDFPISEIAQDTAYPFIAIAKQQNKAFYCHIQPMLTIKGNAKAVEQLISLLLDNAMKYSNKNGNVALTLNQINRSVILSVYNTTSFLVDSSSLTNVFDRFFRQDGSRNSSSGGYGIGLSIAKAITDAHNGKISASTEDGYSFRITVSFPV